MTHKIQHFVPKFVQNKWTDKRELNSKKVTVIFKKYENSCFFPIKLATRTNFCGEGLWSLSSRSPDRTWVESNPFQVIDARAAEVLRKIQTSDLVSENDRYKIAMFLNSIYYRQPEIVGEIRSRAEEGMQELDSDRELYESAHRVFPDLLKTRDLSLALGGLHFSDETVQTWLNEIGHPTVIDDIMASKFHLLRTPREMPLPLSDRPYVTHDIGDDRFRMFPVDPHTLLVLRKENPKSNSVRMNLNLAGLYSVYLKEAISAARRGVVVSCPRSYWQMVGLFSPKELWNRDFGPCTKNPKGHCYSFGEKYAVSQ